MGDARESSLFISLHPSFSGKDGRREEPISVLGGEIGSSKVRAGDWTPSSLFTRPQRGIRALG